MFFSRVATTTMMSTKLSSLAATKFASRQVCPALAQNIPLMAQHFFKLESRSFSTTSQSGSKRRMGTVTRTLQTLDTEIVKKIEKELRSVDTDEDGRIDSEDLKTLLRKHSSVFTDEEIVEFGELFYAGKAGGSISFQDFIEALDKVAGGEDKKIHPILDTDCSVEYFYHHQHHYTAEQLDIKLTHREPKNIQDKLAYNSVKAVRYLFDTASGWKRHNIQPGSILNRVIFLETIAAVPGMVAAITRHFKSLRNMKRDGGFIHMFLEEANNERMHLLSFIRMKDPSTMFRAGVIVSQFGFGSAFGLAYMLSPKFCHRFVGYVEEEACSTYTKIIKAIETAPEGSDLAAWKTELAPRIARSYWKLGENGSVLDMIRAVRADEAEHRDVNHSVSQVIEAENVSYLNDPNIEIRTMLKKYMKDIMSKDERWGEEHLVKA